MLALLFDDNTATFDNCRKQTSIQMLRASWVPQDYIDAGKHLRCQVCDNTKTRTQTHTVAATTLRIVGVDVFEFLDAAGKRLLILNADCMGENVRSGMDCTGIRDSRFSIFSGVSEGRCTCKQCTAPHTQYFLACGSRLSLNAQGEVKKCVPQKSCSSFSCIMSHSHSSLSEHDLPHYVALLSRSSTHSIAHAAISR